MCGGILALAPSTPANQAAPPDRPAYESARALAGRDGAAHVRLALWCEAHGLPAERLKHLAMAVLINPDDAAARAMLGLVAHDGRWARPADVGRKVREDAKLSATLAEYNRRRATAPETADAQWRLALWCEEAGLPAEATAHLSTVVRLEPGRDAAWKRLGCKKVGGRWMTEAQVEAQKAESAAQKEANDRWRPLLAKWRGMLGKSSERAEAEAALASVTDPRSVPAILAVFSRENAADQGRMVQLLGQVDARASSRALALLSVFGGTDAVRRSAVETLKNRDVREFADVLIAMLRDPIKYEYRETGIAIRKAHPP